MKMKRRFLALVMSAALVLTLLPAAVFADDTTLPDNTDPVTDDTGDETDIVKPVEVYFAGNLRGIIGTDELDSETDLYTETFGFKVTYSDDSEVWFDCKNVTIPAEGEDGEPFTVPVYVREGGDPENDADILYPYVNEDEDNPIVFKEGDNKIQLGVLVPYTAIDEETGEEYVEWETLYTDTYVQCRYDKPSAIRFIPADGFVPQGYIGFNYINEETFYGEGNAFEVDYKTQPVDPEYPDFGYTATYKYVREETEDGVVEGFYSEGNTEWDRLDLSEGVVFDLKPGTNTVTLPYTEFIDTLNDEVELELTCDIVAEKYDVYANYPVLDYTGKGVSKTAFAKKLKVYDSLDNKIPASAYTYTWKNNKKMGWYEVELKFKDTSKYVPALTVTYGIGPKTPKVTKLVRGKKKLTATWKKFTKAQLKQIDGMYIEIATDKNFTQNYKQIKVSKKALKKANKKVISKLKKKKKYYVRMYTYKNIKQDGFKFNMFSNDSNIKYAKTK